MKRVAIARWFRVSTLFLAVLLVSGTVNLLSQGVGGTMTGVVKDPKEATVADAKVTAKNTGTNAEYVINTDANGAYRLANLVAGDYSLKVEAKGFKTTTVAAQRIPTGSVVRVDVTLELGNLSETVLVEARASEINTEDGQLGKVLRDPSGLPVLSGNGGRNVLSLAGIQPGVVYAGQLSGQQAGVFSANGQRAQANNYIFDGGDSNDLAINVPDAVQNISPNAVEEFRVITGPIKAEYGRNSGAMILVTPRRGANDLHGGATEIFRNTKLNAAPFFQNAVPGGTRDKLPNGLPRRPQWNSNDFDAELGGPIIRDKTFFFLSYLGFRRRQGVVQSATVFSDAQRAAIQSFGTPESKALLALVPPASTGSLLFSAPSNALNRDQGLGRFDHQFSRANSFAGSYYIEEQTFTDPFAFGGGNIPGFGTTGKQRAQNINLRDAHTFSSRLLNEARASFHRRATLSVIPLNHTKLSSLGLSAIIPDDPSAEGPPNFRLNGFEQFGNTIQGPQGRYDDTFQYIDNVSWTHDRHNIKFGGEFRTYAQNQVFDFENNAIFIIDGSGTTTAGFPGLPLPRRIPAAIDSTGVVNDFASNFATQAIQTSAGHRGYRTRSVNLFAQDDWKVKPYFTLNVGLRWEYNTGLKDVRDRVLTFRPGQQSTVFPTSPVGMVYPGDTGIPRSTYPEDRTDFGPRVGFAWDVLHDGKLSVRGGYGLFYDTPITELTLQFLLATPFAIAPSTIFTDYNNPWLGSRANPIPQPFPFTPVQPGGRFDFTKVAPIGLTVMDPNFQTPYGQQWTLQVQYELKRDWLFEVGYVGSGGHHLLNRREIDPAIPGPGATTGNTNLRRIFNLGNPQLAQFTNGVFGGITDQLTDANSNYHSLQIYVTKRFSHGFQMTHAYTWGHSIDNASGLRVSSRSDFAINPRADRGNSEQNIQHRYVMSYRWDSPAFKNQTGILGHILGGWGVSGVTVFQSGTWFTVTEPQDRCLCTSGNQRPDFVGGTVQILDPRSATAVPNRPNSWFDGTGGNTPTAALNPYFRRVGSAASFVAGAGRFGTLGRNTLQGPGLNNWDISVFKGFRILESHTLEFRAEFFNAWNHTQFLNPNNNIGSANFGIVSTTQDPRIIQLALRYKF